MQKIFVAQPEVFTDPTVGERLFLAQLGANGWTIRAATTLVSGEVLIVATRDEYDPGSIHPEANDEDRVRLVAPMGR